MQTLTQHWMHSWDYRNRLTSSVVSGNTTLYGYDHNNLRVLKGDGTATTTYPNKFHNVNGATTTNHVFLPDGTLIATIESTANGTTTNYVHTDHLSGTNVVTNQEGAVVEVTDYYPFGEQRISSSTQQAEQRKFTGHEYDTETDLTYAKQRYYDQDIGKFLSIDPTSRDNPKQFLEDPQQLNLYTYARNNPIVNKDPEGEIVFEAGLGATVGLFGFSLGFRFDPEVGLQIVRSSSLGLSFGFSIKIDPDKSLEQTHERGETYVERERILVVGVGGYKSTRAEENPSSPLSLANSPKESIGFAVGLEAGYTHSFNADSDIFRLPDIETTESPSTENKKNEQDLENN